MNLGPQVWFVIKEAIPEAKGATQLREELDSLELTQLCLDLEEILPFEIPEKEIQQLSTVEELLDYVQRKLAA